MGSPNICLLAALRTGAGRMPASVGIHAASSIWVKRIGADVPALETTTGALLIALPLFLACWWLVDGDVPVELSVRSTWSIVYLGLFGSVLGFVLYYYVLRQMQASRVALITLITPVLALMLGTMRMERRSDRGLYSEL